MDAIRKIEAEKPVSDWAQIEQLRQTLASKDVEIARLTNELRYIANADVASWDDPTDFRAWAQNRARAALKQPTEQP